MTSFSIKKLSFEKLSIQKKLILTIMGITSLMLLSALSIFIYTELANLKKNMLEDLSVLAEVVGKNSSGAILFEDAKAADENLLALKTTPHIITASLLNNEKSLLARYDRDQIIVNSREINLLLDSQTEGHHYINGNIHIVKRIIFEQDKSFIGMIHIAADQVAYQQRVQDYIITTTILMSIAFVLTLLFAFRAQKIFTAPILKLLTSMQQVSKHHNYDIVLKNQYHDEFSQLIDGYNEMLVQLGEHEKIAIDYQQNLENRVKERTRQLQKARDKALSASRAKSIFLANMSHEIRTPMNAVLGYSQLMQKTALDQQQASYLSIIDKSGKHLLGLINDILELSKIEAGSMEIIKTDFDLLELANNIENMFKIRFDQKKINWQMNFYTQSPVLVSGDQGKLRQILINIIANAYKFTDKGEVLFKVEKLLEDKYQFTIKDSGAGIKKGDLSKIFNAFQQTEKGERKGGTGLGLNIVQRHIELMSGTLKVTSEINHGTIFIFELELTAAKNPLKIEDSSYKPISILRTDRPLSALVVDDIADNAKLLAGILQQIGFKIVCAKNGQLALDEIEKKCPDIVFMDIRMPVMDGIEAITKIRKKYSSRQLKCIAVSASNIQHQADYYHEKGFDLFISKPFNFDDIYYTLTEILGVELLPVKTQLPLQNTAISPLNKVPFLKLEKAFQTKLKQAAEYGQLTELSRLIIDFKDYGQLGEKVAEQLRILINSADLDGILTYIEELNIE